MEREVNELQRQRHSSDPQAERLLTMFGMFGDFWPAGRGFLAEAAALAAEELAYQFLNLALALIFPGIWLFWFGRRRPSSSPLPGN